MSTFTTSSTFTRTHAEYLASKIAADLRQIQCFYGLPSDIKIRRYIEEAVILLLFGYLDSVDYGFKRNGKWVVALSYKVDAISGVLADHNPGTIPVGVNIRGAHWSSYLRENSKFSRLPYQERQKIKELLPFPREGATDPLSDNFGSHDKIYFSGGVSIKRKTIF